MSHPLDLAFEASQRDAFWLPSWATLVDEEGLCFWHSQRPEPMLNTGVCLRGPQRRAKLQRARARMGPSSQWNLAEPSLEQGVEADLGAFGWTPGPTYTLRILNTSTPLSTSEVTVAPVSDRRSLLDAISVADQAFGRGLQPVPEDRIQQELRACTGDLARVHRFVGYLDGEPVSYGGLNSYPQLKVGFLWAGSTLEHARGRGAYRAVLAARLHRARALGLEIVGLYAKHDTSDPIVAAMGFRPLGQMQQFLAD
ncbi:MAG: GNAT family N-acetyltransferase [Myxococcota bacterium]|nr:GNAT family N-acetyltransferase [Myxococcota bacterium]